jgi:hypothetical protein
MRFLAMQGRLAIRRNSEQMIECGGDFRVEFLRHFPVRNEMIV